MSTLNKIYDSALKLFAYNGYEGTSIDMIAKEVGIKKSSVYSHIESKQQLYLSLFNQSLDWNIRTFEKAFKNDESTTENKIKSMLTHFGNKYMHTENKMNLIFIKRTMLFPPMFLKLEYQDVFKNNEDQFSTVLLKVIEDGIKNNEIKNIPTKDILSFFFCTIDGLFIESCYYSKEIYQEKLNTIVNLFWTTIKA